MRGKILPGGETTERGEKDSTQDGGGESGKGSPTPKKKSDDHVLAKKNPSPPEKNVHRKRKEENEVSPGKNATLQHEEKTPSRFGGIDAGGTGKAHEWSQKGEVTFKSPKKRRSFTSSRKEKGQYGKTGGTAPKVTWRKVPRPEGNDKGKNLSNKKEKVFFLE